MRISTGPEYFEAVANHPEVLPKVTCAGVDRIDLAPIWGHCIGLEFSGGGWVLIELAPRVLEVHTLFLPKSADIQAKAEQMLAYVFPTLADELVTYVPADLPHAKRLAVRNGFKFISRVTQGWVRDTGPVDLDRFRLTYQDHMERVSCQLPAP